ncbi:hypothetical protein Nepgr_028935 [Nepenthes gracilis]|uniref:Uncharacterized protein n=1 Tax=Nepenthes gracilis TaxID=150966 RepID=A0AAD3TEF3_NEPGR|nr:hypothetical protein Nepgr_028935 [Nepenthes gracilis]
MAALRTSAQYHRSTAAETPIRPRAERQGDTGGAGRDTGLRIGKSITKALGEARCDRNLAEQRRIEDEVLAFESQAVEDHRRLVLAVLFIVEQLSAVKLYAEAAAVQRLILLCKWLRAMMQKKVVIAIWG